MKAASLRRRWLLITGALLVLFTITGFFIAPPIVKAQLEKRLSAELGRRVTIDRVKLNPYALSLTLENLAIQERDGTQRFVGWERLYVNFDALASLHGEWVLSEIVLDGFNARVAINKDESFNFSDLLAKFTTPAAAPAPAPVKSSSPPRPVRIGSLKVGQAQVAFSDASRAAPFATTLGPLTFSLTEFRTVSERGAPYRFEAVTEANEKLTWTGTLQAEPLKSSGELRLENIVLAKYAPYYADKVQADLTAGTLSVRGKYELTFAANDRTLRLKDGALQLRGVKIAERGSKELAIDLPEFSVNGVEADALTMKAAVASMALSGGHLRVRREKDGALNWQTMLMPAKPAPPATANAVAAPASKPPEFLIGAVAVKDFRVDVTDLAAPRPAQLELRDLQLSLKNVTLAEGAEMPLQVTFASGAQGTARLDGMIAIAPVKSDLKVELANLELLPLSPYLEQFVNARLTQGILNVKLATHLALRAGQPPAASAIGDVQVDKLGLVDTTHNEELAGFGALNLRNLRISAAPELNVALDEIKIAAPYARVIINKDQTLNLATVLKPPAGHEGGPRPPAAVPLPPPTPAPAPKIEIGQLVITDGDYRFTDRSIEPNVRMAISQFGGTITGLSSTTPGKGTVDLKAVVDGAGPIVIAGKLDPLGAKPAVDLKVDFKNVDLMPLSPYSGKFAGYELARGKLLLDVKLLVDGQKIDSANVITLNQFTFGGPVRSPDATKLPVRLGVALLKDLDGKIVIDVPVQGDLSDPNFRVGRVVLRVITNLLAKAAASPFTLLGAAFGGGGDELAFQEFAPGTADLLPSEMKKLETMAKALTNRPALSVALDGHYDAAADTYALKRVKFAGQVRRAIWEKKHETDPSIPPPAELVITPEENVAMIKKLFDEKFPPGTKFGAPVPPPPAVVSPPPPPEKFYQRWLRVLTLQARREQRAIEQENAQRKAEHEKAVEAALAAGVPLDEMSARLAEATSIDDNDLRALAQARAQSIRDYFVKTGGIAAERLFLAKEAPSEGASPAASKGPRVFLTLQ